MNTSSLRMRQVELNSLVSILIYIAVSIWRWSLLLLILLLLLCCINVHHYIFVLTSLLYFMTLSIWMCFSICWSIRVSIASTVLLFIPIFLSILLCFFKKLHQMVFIFLSLLLTFFCLLLGLYLHQLLLLMLLREYLTLDHFTNLHYQFIVPLYLCELDPPVHLLCDEWSCLIHHHSLCECKFWCIWLWLELKSLII